MFMDVSNKVASLSSKIIERDQNNLITRILYTDG